MREREKGERGRRERKENMEGRRGGGRERGRERVSVTNICLLFLNYRIHFTEEKIKCSRWSRIERERNSYTMEQHSLTFLSQDLSSSLSIHHSTCNHSNILYN